MREEKQEKITEEQVEVLEPDQESPLDSLLRKVDLASPLEIPLDNGQILSIKQEQFIDYWLPKDASREEKAKCFNETRAAGLNPAIKGDCHYFRTGDSPLGLFVGYHVYLRKAYQNGLIHMHRPEITYVEETGLPFSCVLTLEIEGRPDFIWETWYSEVEGQTRGVANKRWVKAPQQMLIKCSITNTLRLSGIATLGILPPAIEEMPDFAAPGMRSMTQGDIDRWKNAPQAMMDKMELEEKLLGEASIGKVDAATHQVDYSRARIGYFTSLKDAGITFESEDERRTWQKETVGKEHVNDFVTEDYQTMSGVIAHMKLANETMAEKSGKKAKPELEAQVDQADPTETKDGTRVEEAVKDAVDQGVQEAEERKGAIDEMFSLAGELGMDRHDLRAFINEEFLGQTDWKWAHTTASDASRVIERLKAKQEQPVTQAEPEKPQEEPSVALVVFLELAKDKFASELVRDDWIGTITEKPMNEWSVSETTIATQALSELVDLPGAHVPAKETPQQGEDERKRQELKAKFLELAEKRFPDVPERFIWINDKVGPVNDKIDMDDWDPKLFESGIKLLSAGDDAEKMSEETRTILRNALADFPDKKYQTMKSMAFRKFANEAIEGSMSKVSDLTEKDGKLIVWKLEKEKADIEQKVEQIRTELLDEDGDPLEDGMMTEKDAAAEAESQAAFAKEQEAQEPEQKDGADWIEHEMEQGEVTGEVVAGEIIDEDPLGQGLDATMNDEQFEKMKELIEDMPERFRSIGSETVRDFIFDTVKHGFKRIKDITESEADDVILAMGDMVADENKPKVI